MPYRSVSDLPNEQVDQYSEHQKHAFLEALNNAYEEYHGDESRAFATRSTGSPASLGGPGRRGVGAQGIPRGPGAAPLPPLLALVGVASRRRGQAPLDRPNPGPDTRPPRRYAAEASLGAIEPATSILANSRHRIVTRSADPANANQNGAAIPNDRARRPPIGVPITMPPMIATR